MSSASLYLIQSNIQQTPAILTQLSSLWESGDQVILMGEAILAYQHPFLQQLSECYVLTSDLPLLPATAQHTFKPIDYAEFADLCLQFTRCISLK